MLIKKIFIMKKTIVLLAFIFLSVTVSAQISFGLRAGMDISSYYSASSIYSFKPGVHLGAIIDFPFAQKFSFVSGLYLTDKGTKAKGDFPPDNVYFLLPVESYSFNETINNYQIELPLLFTYKIPLNSNISLKPQIGAYFAYTIFGKMKDERVYNTGNKTISKNYSVSDGIFGIGANVGISVLYNKFSFTYSCDFGISNKDEGYSTFYSEVVNYPDICMFLSLGYNF